MKSALTLARLVRRTFGLLGLGALALAAAPAAAKVDVAPYLEVQQVLNADLNGGDVLTYSSAVAGISGAVAGETIHRMAYRPGEAAADAR